MSQTDLAHGGDWAGYLDEFGSLPLDFSINVNPLGMPDNVRDAIVNALDGAWAYPDPLCRGLSRKLAALFGVDAQQVLCGNGASDLFERLARAVRPQVALMCAPTFSEYAVALQRVGCTVVEHVLNPDDGFVLDESILDDIDDQTDVLFLCEPNNPTGVLDDTSLLQRIAQRCADCNVLLAVDECFMEFVTCGFEATQPEPSPVSPSLAPNQHNDATPGCQTRYHTLMQTGTRLVVFRAFTKSFAMAGVRLGYCIASDPQLVRQMRDAGQPWSVSSLAQAAGMAALDNLDSLQQMRAVVAHQRPRLQQALSDLGLHVVDGCGNFVLFYSDDPQLGDKMRQRGVLIRDCSNFDSLQPGWFRVAVRTQDQNDKLIQALGECCE